MTGHTCKVSIAVVLALTTMSIAAAERPTRAVDVVFCLDASGSMDPLLDEVRARLWDVVNEFDGLSPTPEVRVGLLIYGVTAAGPAHGWLVKVSDLSASLDEVYSALMSVKTGGSKEYVGWVLDTAIESMSWSEDPDALKLILVAGNEEADQASEIHDFHEAVRTGLDRGIVVDALYAGSADAAEKDRWPEIAAAGRGTFAAVRPSPNLVRIETPQDGEIAALNERLNATYVPFGPEGRNALDAVRKRDETAAGLGAQSLAGRVATKAGGLYRNATWDLVDAMDDPTFDLAAVDPQDLPEEIRFLAQDELLAYVDAKRAEREQVRERIRAVDAERRQLLRAKIERRGRPGVVDAMRRAVREQAEASGFVREDRRR